MRIERIVGLTPRSSEDNQMAWALGFDAVVRIEEETENLGTYGITWFKCYNEHGEVVGKMNALYVANVEYTKQP